jgi:hypothetical protein
MADSTDILPSGVELTPELADRLLQGARTGLFKETVAIGCGIAPERLDEWIRMGLSPGATEPYRTFARYYAAAEQGSQMPHVSAWQQAAAVDWRAAQAFLAARYPGQWGPKATVRQASELQPSVADAQAEEDMVRALLRQRPPVLMRLLEEEGFTPPAETAPPRPPKRD